MSGQIIFIMWRESVEALLVIGILQAWLSQNAAGTGAARYLWGGVASGIGLALLLAFSFMRLSAWLPPDGQEYFVTAMMAVAVLLIVQMVLWMRKNGRSLKASMEQGLSQAAYRQRWWGVYFLALIAVAREGSETVIFIFGLASARGNSGWLALYGAIALGFTAALLTYFALQFSRRFMSWRWFFKITEALLLLLGASLAVSTADKLISLGVLPYTAFMWDTSWLLDDGTRFGGVIGALTGYRSNPDAVTLWVWLLYWGSVAALFGMQRWRNAASRARAKAATTG